MTRTIAAWQDEFDAATTDEQRAAIRAAILADGYPGLAATIGYAVATPDVTWPELVTLAAKLGPEFLPHAAARDIARHRAVLPAVVGSERRYASPVLRRFLFNGEITDGRWVPIADALFTGREVVALDDGSCRVYVAFLAYLTKRTNPQSGPATTGPVRNWSALTLSD